MSMELKFLSLPLFDLGQSFYQLSRSFYVKPFTILTHLKYFPWQ